MNWIPDDIAQIEGCDCGSSGEYHRADTAGQVSCSLMGLPYEQARANIDAQYDRVQAYIDEKNRVERNRK